MDSANLHEDLKLNPSNQMANSNRDNSRWRKRKRRGSFQFRRWEPGGSVPFGDDEIPEFNLDSVTRALSQDWDPNTSWTEDELVFPPPGSGCVVPMASDPWCHFNTAIHRALWLSQFDVAECLLTHGANINQLNALGRTVLHEALDIGINDFNGKWTEKATWIVEHGADLNKKTEARTVLVTKQDHDGHEYKSSQLGGVSPLMMAMQLGSLDKVQRLVDAGVNVNLSIDDEARWRPLDLALMSRQLHMMEVLEQAGASLSVNMAEKVYSEAINIEKLSQVQLQAEADELLSFCLTRSHKGLPERECKSIYRYILETIEFRSTWVSRDKMSTLENYKSSNDAFFKVLSSLARTRNPYAVPESYCTLCTGLIAHYSGINKGAGVRFQHASTLKTLEDAAAANGCPLCGMLLDALELNLDGKRKKPDPADMPDAPIELNILGLYLGGNAELQVKCGDRSSGLALKHLSDDLLHDLLDHPDDLDLGTGSLRALALGRTWINNCKRGHPRCRRPQDLSPPILPTRVLDIAAGTAMRPMARLVETCGTMRGAYCALSYCWGTSQGVTTTKHNLESHKVNVPIERLAATLQDAIVAALGLGFRYLWADGLCIVQDDPLDWDSEAEKMSLVYANATITISTIIGTDCGEGLFKQRVLRQPTPLPFPAKLATSHGDARRPLLAVHPPTDYNGQYKHHPGFKFRGPIHSRGWTCQEQMLSTRILWYGPGHLQWECMSLYAADQSPSGITYQSNYPGDSPVSVTRTKEYVHRSMWRTINIEEEQPSITRSFHEQTKCSLLDEWENIVVEYSKRSLSVSSDRIPAILGLAKAVEPSIKCEFIAGLWKGEHFLRSLLWRVDKPSSSARTTTHYPSWTWASVDGTTIEYDLFKDTTGHEVTWLASLISLDVSLKGKAQSGATGSVTIRGPLSKMSPAEIDRIDPSKLQFDYGMLDHPSYYPDTAEGASWYVDIMKTGQGPTMSGYGYPLWPNGRPGSTVRLFLEPLDHLDPPRTFRRIGIGRFGWDANDVVVREVDII